MTSYGAFGTLFKIGDGAGSESFTTIAQVRAINGVEITLDRAETTHHSSTGGWKEKVATVLGMSEITLDLNFDPAHATHSYVAGLIKDLVDKTLRNFQIVFPDSGTTTWTIPAFVASVNIGAPHDDRLSATVTLDPSGQPTLA